MRGTLTPPEHTLVSGRLQGGRWPASVLGAEGSKPVPGEHVTQVTHGAASPCTQLLHNQRMRSNFNGCFIFNNQGKRAVQRIWPMGLRFSSKPHADLGVRSCCYCKR